MWLITEATNTMLDKLDNVGTNIKPSGEYYHYGNLRNMKVRLSNNRVIIDGSLPKFLFGHNFKRCDRIETKHAIEKLSDTLGLPFHHAHVSRIDIADNFIMNQPVHEYLQLLGEACYFERLPRENGNLYYKNFARVLIFYDKIREFNDKKCANLIPDAFAGKNVLRYELRYLRHVAKQLKSEILGKDLYNEDFYFNLIRRWCDAYLKIKKLNVLNHMEFKIKNRQDFKNYGFMITLLDEEHKQAVWSRLELARQSGEMTVRTYYRCKEDFARLLTNARYFEPADLIKELDEKVRLVAKLNIE